MKTRIKRLQEQITSYLLLGTLFLNCNLVYAESTPAPQVINIVGPNMRGISINRLDSFDVPKEGMVLNNSNKEVQTELAGMIAANPHLSGFAAVIVNEVRGTNKSNLLGSLEVAGHQADVVIANPNGIFLDNARFINSNNVSLWAGKTMYRGPQLREIPIGAEVTNADIDVGRGGISTDEGGKLNFIARTMGVKGPIKAGQIDVFLGKGQIYGAEGVQNENSADTAVAANPKERLLDIAEMGGMYANSIYLQTLESGTGIKSEGALKATDKLTLNANGDIMLQGEVKGAAVKVKTPYNVDISHDTNKDVFEIKEKENPDQQQGSTQEQKKNMVILPSSGGAIIANITTPDKYGISLNDFADFQVGSEGFIFNNSLTDAKTQLAGNIAGNTNFFDRTAHLIIGEVNGNKLSNINGTIEIAGDRAGLVVANPNGIAFNGGKLLNTDRASFVVGSVDRDDQDSEKKFNVGQGSIVVKEKGLDAKDVSQLNLIANTAQIGGAAEAENINVLLGGGNVDYATLQTSPSEAADSNSEEQFMEVLAKGKLLGRNIVIAAGKENLGLVNNGEINASQLLKVNLNGNILLNGLTHGDTTQIITTKDIANNGLIDGGRVYINGNVLVNKGGIFGEYVAIKADSIANEGLKPVEPKKTLTQEKINQKIDELVQRIFDDNKVKINISSLTAENKANLIKTGILYPDLSLNNPPPNISLGALILFTTKYKVDASIYQKYTALMSGEVPDESAGAEEQQNTKAGVVYASQRLDIGSKNTYNKQGAVLYSDGDIRIGGSLDANDEATGTAEGLYNDGATIQATGSTYANAKIIQNTNPNLKMQTQEGAWVNNPDRIEIDAPGSEYNHVIATKDHFARLTDKYSYDYMPYSDKYLKYINFDIDSIDDFYSSEPRECDYEHSDHEEDFTVDLGYYLEAQKNVPRILTQLEINYKPRDFTKETMKSTITTAIQQKYGKTVDEYNAMVDEYNKKATFANYWQIRSKHQDIKSNVLKSTPGKITAGNDLQLIGSVTNKDSLLLAGERLEINGTLDNLASAVTDGVKYSGTIEHSHPHQYWHHLHNKTKRVWENKENYQEPDDMVTYYLPTIKYYTSSAAGNPTLALTDQEYLAYKDGAYWLSEEEKEVNGTKEKNLIVHVDGGSNIQEKQANSLLSAKEVIINSTGDNTNQGTILSNTLSVKTKSFTNEGELRGKDITFAATENIDNTGNMIAENKLNLSAKNINSTTAEVLANKENKEDSAEEGFVVTGDDSLLLLHADENITIQNNHLANGGKNGKIVLDAGGNINFATDTFNYRIGTTDSENNLRIITTDSGSIAEAEGDIALQAGGDVNIKASAVRSASGKVSLLAGQDINVTTGKNSVDTKYKYRYKNGGIGSKRGTTTSEEKSYEKDPIPSEIKGDTILFAANRDINLLSSNSIDRNNSLFKAGRDITSAVDTGFKTTEYTRTFSGSGISLGDGFLGIRIGKWTESHQTNTSEENPVPTNITSTNGHVDLDAEGKVHATTTYIYGKDGVTIAGSSVILDGTEAKSTYKQVDAYSFKGLTVGLGGKVYAHLNNAYMFAGNAFRAQDKRLAILEGIESGKEMAEYSKYLDADEKDKFTLSLALTSQSSKQTYDNTVIHYEGGMVASDGDIVIKAKDKENGAITLIGQTLSGKKIELETYHLNIESGENSSTTGEHSESTSGSAGVDIGNGSVTPSAGGSKTDSDTKAKEVSYTPTTLTGDSIEIVSGGNTNIKGSIISGKNVKLDIGGNLDITSDQNSYTYNSKTSSVGFNIGLKSGSAQASTGKTDYTLKTVVEQAGINAGEEGLDINVKGKTTLTGAVIGSKADKTKNQITTGDLEMKNIENSSSEKDSNLGIGYNKDTNKANEQGLIPMLPIAGKDEQKSTTYAAIVDGKLVVTGNKDFKEEEVNRNTENTLNALANTLDTQKIAERKKLAELFAKNAFELVHTMTDEKHMNLPEGSAGKVVLHAVVAGITAKLGGDSFAAGSMTGAINEIMNGAISSYEKAHNKGLTPAEHQWISAAVGAIVNSATGSTIQTGMADAVYATKWNYLMQLPPKDKLAQIIAEKCDLDTIKDKEIIGNIIKSMESGYFDVYNPSEAALSLEFNSVQYGVFIDKLKAAGITEDSARKILNGWQDYAINNIAKYQVTLPTVLVVDKEIDKKQILSADKNDAIYMIWIPSQTAKEHAKDAGVADILDKQYVVGHAVIVQGTRAIGFGPYNGKYDKDNKGGVVIESSAYVMDLVAQGKAKIAGVKYGEEAAVTGKRINQYLNTHGTELNKEKYYTEMGMDKDSGFNIYGLPVRAGSIYRSCINFAYDLFMPENSNLINWYQLQTVGGQYIDYTKGEISGGD